MSSIIQESTLTESHDQPEQALAGDITPVTVTGDSRTGWAPITAFAHRPDNPRWQREYLPEEDPELRSFQATVENHGVLQAVTVTSKDAWLKHHPDHSTLLADEGLKWVVVMGNRRLASSKLSGIDGLPFVRNDHLAQPSAAREAGIIENYHRKGLDPIREAAELVAIQHDTGESNRDCAERLGMSHTQLNQRLQLLQLLPEFQGMVSDLVLPVQKALPIARLDQERQQALLALGAPFAVSRLTEAPAHAEAGKTLSTVTIRKHSTPTDVVHTLRAKLSPDMLDEVVKLLHEE